MCIPVSMFVYVYVYVCECISVLHTDVQLVTKVCVYIGFCECTTMYTSALVLCKIRECCEPPTVCGASVDMSPG